MIKITVNAARWIIFSLIGSIFIGIMLWFLLGNPFNKPENIINIDIPNTGKIEKGSFLLYQNNCDIQETGEYKYIDIASVNNRIYTEEEANYKHYTKNIEISGNITDLRLCVMGDISDKSNAYTIYKKPNTYNAMIYLYFNGDTRGYINVAYSPISKQFYDSNSNNKIIVNDSLLDGKFWSSETPKKYLLNLKNIIVANTKEGGYKYISPINLFSNGAKLNIGGFMSPLSSKAYWASSISSYKLLYKGDGKIILK